MFRRWYRSSFVNLVLLAAASHAGAAPASGKAKLPLLLQKVEAKYRESPTLVASFQQINESAVLKDRKKSSGLISLKRPGKMRWETKEPDPSLFVTDGKTMWFYTPPFDKGESGQVVVRKASQYQSRLAGALLAGEFSFGKDLKIREAGADHFILTPKPGSAGDVLDAELFVDPKTLLIERVILKHEGGNLTEITLSGIRLGDSLEDGKFQFTAPPKTDVVPG